MRVEIYWNLHKGAYSVRALEGRYKGLVIGRARDVLIRDASFVVREAGRQRVIREKRKNVHAFVRGTLEAAQWIDTAYVNYEPMPWTKGDTAYAQAARRLGRGVSYNPYNVGHFFDRETYERVTTAPMVLLACASKHLKAALLAFDPCNMTEAESLAATI